MQLTSADATLDIDPQRGVLQSLKHQQVTLLEGKSGLFDLALPLPDDLPHRLPARGGHPLSVIQHADGGVTLVHPTLTSERGEHQVACALRIQPIASGGFALQLTVVNHTPHVIPQVLFPYLQGLVPTGDPKQQAMHLGRSVKWPHAAMDVPHDAASFYDLYRRWYFEYGMQDWNVKWWRLGDRRHGIAAHSDELGATVQGLSVERERSAASLTVAWAHYPHIAPGQTWVSPAFTLYPHAGGWRDGIQPYKQWVAAHLPTVATSRYLRASLGVRSVFFSTYLYDNDANFRFTDLPRVARDALAHGVREVVAWFMFRSYFELPMQLNPKLGTADELRAALAECRAIGVNVSAFVSLRSLKTRATPIGWFEEDEVGNRRSQAWSYSLRFVPAFNPPYCHRDESSFVCPGVPAYRNAFLNGCRALHALGFSSVCFDQMFADRLCYAAGHDHAKPNETFAPLYGMLRAAHGDGRRVDPDATLSGEFFTDVSQTFQHYNWDWIGGQTPPAELDAFRYLFPRFRLGMLVDRSRYWLLEAFTRGLTVNFLPDGGEGLIAHDPQFSALVGLLARYRAAYARFFEEGDYLGAHPLRGTHPTAAVYHAGGEHLLVASNPSDQPTLLDVALDLPGVWGRQAEVIGPWGVVLIHLKADGGRAVIA